MNYKIINRTNDIRVANIHLGTKNNNAAAVLPATDTPSEYLVGVVGESAINWIFLVQPGPV